MSVTITATTIRTTSNHILVWYRANPFSCENAMAYVQKSPRDMNGKNLENVQPKDTFEIPANPIPYQKTGEDGNIMCTKDGEPLTFLKW